MIDLRKLADILQPPDKFYGHDSAAGTRGEGDVSGTMLPDTGFVPRPTVAPDEAGLMPNNNGIATLGGFQTPTVPPEIPSDTPLVEPSGRTPFAATAGGLAMPQPDVPVEPEVAPPRIAFLPSMRTKSEIDRVENKDYSKRPNPNYDPTKPATTRKSPGGDTNNKYVYGKDYDRSRGFKDFLRSAGLGALGGFLRGGIGGAIGGAATGGIRGAINPNTDNQMLDQMKLESLYPQYQRQFETEQVKQKAEQDAAYRKAQTDTIYTDDARQREDLQRKSAKDQAQIEYWGRKADQGDWKLINDEKLMELRDKWAESKNENDKRRLALTEKEMTYRNIRSKLDRESRERIAGWRESGLNRRQQLASEARQLVTQFQEAQRNNRAEEQRALQERLAEIKAEAQANP